MSAPGVLQISSSIFFPISLFLDPKIVAFLSTFKHSFSATVSLIGAAADNDSTEAKDSHLVAV